MRATYSVTKDHNYGINQTPRETLVHCLGSASKENTVQVLATITNSGSERNKFLSNQSKIKPAVTGRVEVVEGEFTSSERQTTENRNTTVNNPNGCFQNRLEGSLSGNHHGGNLVISGKDKTYQYTGAHCSETCNIDLYQKQIGNSNPLTNRQYDSSVLLGKNGGNSQSRTATSSQGNMGLSVSQWNSSYSRVLTKQSEYSGRLAIQKSQGFKQLEIEPQNIFSDCENQRNTSNRPICFLNEPSVTKIHVLASGPRQLCSRFPSALLEKPLRICIPSILLNRKGTCQNKERLVSSSYRNTSMANSAMVFSISRNVCSTSHNSIQPDDTVTRSWGARTPFAGRQPATVGGMEGFRKALEGEGVSKLAATLITNSRRSGSISNYQSAWRKWASWCCEREVNPFTSNIIEILNFLAFLYEKGYEYSSINSHRSAISAYHVHIDNNPIGQHPRVCTLMTGIFNNRPPKPRYTSVWDIETVLNYLSKLQII